MSERILMNEFRSLSSEKWVRLELHDDNIFKWDVAIVVLNPDSLYYGGYFKALMTFPQNYPYAPPAFRFLLPIYHPNIHTDGRVCISILHPPGDDEMSGESAAERWSPAQRVESVLISILSLLDDAEISSPANVDAAVMLRNNPTAYRAKVKQNVESSRATAPVGFASVELSDLQSIPQEVEKDDSDFWMDSDVDSDPFGGSDSDGDLDMDPTSGSDIEDEDEDSEDIKA